MKKHTIEDQIGIVQQLTARAKTAPMLAVKPVLEKLADEQLRLSEMITSELTALRHEVDTLRGAING